MSLSQLFGRKTDRRPTERSSIGPETDKAWQMMLLALPTQLAQEPAPNASDSLQGICSTAVRVALERAPLIAKPIQSEENSPWRRTCLRRLNAAICQPH